MYAKGRKKGTVRFKVGTDKGTRKVSLVGDFNAWEPLVMRKQKDGSFAATLAVAPGRHEYKFVLDGDWTHDPDVPEMVMNSYGTFNSVAVVE